MFINSYDLLEITGLIFRATEPVSSIYFTWRSVCSVNSPGNKNPVTLHDINGQILNLQRSYTDLYQLRLCLLCCVLGTTTSLLTLKQLVVKINKTDKLDKLDNKKKKKMLFPSSVLMQDFIKLVKNKVKQTQGNTIL